MTTVIWLKYSCYGVKPKHEQTGNLHERMLLDVRIKHATICIQGGRASDRAAVHSILGSDCGFAWVSECHMSRLMTKPTKWHVCPAKTQISLGIHPVWSESSLSAWRKLGYPMGAQWRLIRLGGCPGWSESLLGAESFCWFCHEAAQLCLILFICIEITRKTSERRPISIALLGSWLFNFTRYGAPKGFSSDRGKIFRHNCSKYLKFRRFVLFVCEVLRPSHCYYGHV